MTPFRGLGYLFDNPFQDLLRRRKLRRSTADRSFPRSFGWGIGLYAATFGTCAWFHLRAIDTASTLLLSVLIAAWSVEVEERPVWDAWEVPNSTALAELPRTRWEIWLALRTAKFVHVALLLLPGLPLIVATMLFSSAPWRFALALGLLLMCIMLGVPRGLRDFSLMPLAPLVFVTSFILGKLLRATDVPHPLSIEPLSSAKRWVEAAVGAAGYDEPFRPDAWFGLFADLVFKPSPCFGWRVAPVLPIALALLPALAREYCDWRDRSAQLNAVYGEGPVTYWGPPPFLPLMDPGRAWRFAAAARFWILNFFTLGYLWNPLVANGALTWGSGPAPQSIAIVNWMLLSGFAALLEVTFSMEAGDVRYWGLSRRTAILALALIPGIVPTLLAAALSQVGDVIALSRGVLLLAIAGGVWVYAAAAGASVRAHLGRRREWTIAVDTLVTGSGLAALAVSVYIALFGIKSSVEHHIAALHPGYAIATHLYGGLPDVDPVAGWAGLGLVAAGSWVTRRLLRGPINSTPAPESKRPWEPLRSKLERRVATLLRAEESAVLTLGVRAWTGRTTDRVYRLRFLLTPLALFYVTTWILMVCATCVGPDGLGADWAERLQSIAPGAVALPLFVANQLWFESVGSLLPSDHAPRISLDEFRLTPITGEELLRQSVKLYLVNRLPIAICGNLVAFVTVLALGRDIRLLGLLLIVFIWAPTSALISSIHQTCGPLEVGGDWAQTRSGSASLSVKFAAPLLLVFFLMQHEGQAPSALYWVAFGVLGCAAILNLARLPAAFWRAARSVEAALSPR